MRRLTRSRAFERSRARWRSALLCLGFEAVGAAWAGALAAALGSGDLGVKVGPVLRVALIRPADEAEEAAGGVEEVRTAFPDIRDESREEERARKPAAGTRHLIRSDD